MAEENNKGIPANQGNNKENKVGYKRPPIDKQWKPGESGNPAGRPKDPGITALQEGMLDEICPYDLKGRTYRVWLAERGLILASEKDSALENLKNRLEGKVEEKIGIQGEVLITPNMRALAAREMIEAREEEARLLNVTEQSQE